MTTYELLCSKAFRKNCSSEISSARKTLEMKPEEGANYSMDIISNHKDDQDHVLKSARAEMAEVREENEKLKQLLEGIMKDYQSLKTRFFDILQQEKSNNPTNTVKRDHEENDEEPYQLVSLSLGRTSSTEVKKDENIFKNRKVKLDDEELMNEGIELRLDFKFDPAGLVQDSKKINDQSSENCFKEMKKELPADEIWPPKKIMKTMISEDNHGASEMSHLKKARVSVRARCETPTINDGCQWRKYGQKIAKGNPCPRAYYRCTVSPTCPVRKLVQRCKDDMSILITTYEGTHNHPLPLAATAMASTTSAAVSMLQSHSSTSNPTLGTTIPAPISTINRTSTNLYNLMNFSATTNNISSKPNPFNYNFLTNSTISTSKSHPTITLDLTSPNPKFAGLSSGLRSYDPSSSSTCLSFSSFNSLQRPLFNFGPFTNNYNRNPTGFLNNNGNNAFAEYVLETYMKNVEASSKKCLASEKIASASTDHDITMNPKVGAALAATLNSFGWGSNYLNRSSSLNSQVKGGLISFPDSLPLFNSSKNGSGSA